MFCIYFASFFHDVQQIFPTFLLLYSICIDWCICVCVCAYSSSLAFLFYGTPSNKFTQVQLDLIVFLLFVYHELLPHTILIPVEKLTLKAKNYRYISFDSLIFFLYLYLIFNVHSLSILFSVLFLSNLSEYLKPEVEHTDRHKKMFKRNKFY